jgi:hypothetical protein
VVPQQHPPAVGAGEAGHAVGLAGHGQAAVDGISGPLHDDVPEPVGQIEQVPRLAQRAQARLAGGGRDRDNRAEHRDPAAARVQEGRSDGASADPDQELATLHAASVARR